ncbi:MAG: glycosyltransferase family 2 protein [Treponema sp.]|nr:glycosyltransferase family 2 protein [Treponema sp.]
MITSPLVSIITPNYNCERFISQTIESVLAQTYKNWEMLIVDDCSTDKSYEIACEYAKKDSRIKVFRNKKNSGAAVSRNVAIEKSKGQYVAFLDSDDIWLPQKLEVQLKSFQNDVAIVYSFYEKIDSEGNRSDRIIYSPKETNFRNMLKSDVIGNLTGIYDTSLVGKIYQKKVHQEDYIMWLEILRLGYKAICCQEVLAYYRISATSLSHSKIRHLKWQWDSYRKELKLNLLISIYYYANYAIRGFFKFLK